MNDHQAKTVITLLETIAKQLAVLVADRPPSPIVLRGRLSKEDYDSLAIALPAIRRSVRGAIFTLEELREHAEFDADLRAALDAAGLGNGAKRFGKLLARATGAVVVSHQLRRERDDRAGARWRVTRVSGDFETR